MTEFRSFPRIAFDLPADGKVTGTAEMIFRGGTAQVRTTAHINDDLPCIEYRGRGFLVTIELHRADDGTVSIRPDQLSTYASVRDRANWSDAPPTFATAIREAIRAHAETLWTDDLDADGADATYCQRMCSLEDDERKQANELKATRSAIRKLRTVHGR